MSRTAIGAIGIGAMLGLTWAASLRGWMIQLAGAESRFTWVGTFLCLLLPGVLVGASVGWAVHLGRTGARIPGWLVWTPMLFAVGTLSIPGAIPHLLATGEGSASVGMVVLAMLAGHALSGRGPVWRRVVAGTIGFAVVPAMVAGSLGDPKRAWAATLFAALFTTLATACAVPQRLRAKR